MRINNMPTADEVLAENLKDPAFQQEWERTELARAVAIQVAAYRADHDLTQSELARQLGMSQPAIARLESGEHTPTVQTLQRLSRGFGLDFHLDITPESLTLSR
jgi:DNA-binding XRE family transcriptional regulator